MTYSAPFTLIFGSAYPALTLQAQIKTTAGVNVGAAITTGFVNFGGGNYSWYHAAFTDGFAGVVLFTSTAGATPAVSLPVAISPADSTTPPIATVDLAALAVAMVAALGGAPVTVTSPVAASGGVSIVRGDDYINADGRALEWTNPAGTWPDLTGATITFTARLWDSTLTKTGSVIVPTGAGQKVRVELTKTETAIALGTYGFDVQATLLTVPTRVVTLVQGALVVTGDTAA